MSAAASLAAAALANKSPLPPPSARGDSALQGALESAAAKWKQQQQQIY